MMISLHTPNSVVYIYDMSFEVQSAIRGSSPLSHCVLHSHRSIIPTLRSCYLADKSLYLPATLACLYHCPDILPYSYLLLFLYIPDIVNIWIVFILSHHFLGLHPVICKYMFACCAISLNSLVRCFFSLFASIVLSYQFVGLVPLTVHVEICLLRDFTSFFSSILLSFISLYCFQQSLSRNLPLNMHV